MPKLYVSKNCTTVLCHCCPKWELWVFKNASGLNYYISFIIVLSTAVVTDVPVEAVFLYNKAVLLWYKNDPA
jgi:hypothetical protein